MDTTALPRSLLWMFSGALAPAAIKIRLCNVEISQQCSHQQRRAHTSSHMDPSHSKKKKKKKKKKLCLLFSVHRAGSGHTPLVEGEQAHVVDHHSNDDANMPQLVTRKENIKLAWKHLFRELEHVNDSPANVQQTHTQHVTHNPMYLSELDK
mmetsp:Transcript_27725/g.39177  ORF Transcript_27725/g.39177 Transcript_27725/m.39177 type:complete len:152 (+) Transcript_27725:131-586(+)